MTAKYTPGPWIEGLDESGVVVVKRDTAHAIARLGPIWEQTEETMANARLIAAAPEQQAKIDALADAATEAVQCCRGRHSLVPECEVCRPWIAALRAAGRLP